MDLDEKQLAGFIDHSLLGATVTSEQIRRLCEEAKTYGFFSVSLNPRWVSLAADLLADSSVKIGGVVSLPLGADTTKIKVACARDAIFAGADEIDMVADLAAIIEYDSHYLVHQFLAVLDVCHSMRPPVILKVIIEAAALNPEQKEFICSILNRCGVDFVKTSTGMHPAGGATLDDVTFIKQFAPKCKVKAAGGIKTVKQALNFLNAGTDRIGTSCAVNIIEEFRMGDF